MTDNLAALERASACSALVPYAVAIWVGVYTLLASEVPATHEPGATVPVFSGHGLVGALDAAFAVALLALAAFWVLAPVVRLPASTSGRYTVAPAPTNVSFANLGVDGRLYTSNGASGVPFCTLSGLPSVFSHCAVVALTRTNVRLGSTIAARPFASTDFTASLMSVELAP